MNYNKLIDKLIKHTRNEKLAWTSQWFYKDIGKANKNEHMCYQAEFKNKSLFLKSRLHFSLEVYSDNDIVLYVNMNKITKYDLETDRYALDYLYDTIKGYVIKDITKDLMLQDNTNGVDNKPLCEDEELFDLNDIVSKILSILLKNTEFNKYYAESFLEELKTLRADDKHKNDSLTRMAIDARNNIICKFLTMMKKQ